MIMFNTDIKVFLYQAMDRLHVDCNMLHGISIMLPVPGELAEMHLHIFRIALLYDLNEFLQIIFNLA